jgi:hypothetical protein
MELHEVVFMLSLCCWPSLPGGLNAQNIRGDQLSDWLVRVFVGLYNII